MEIHNSFPLFFSQIGWTKMGECFADVCRRQISGFPGTPLWLSHTVLHWKEQQRNSWVSLVPPPSPPPVAFSWAPHPAHPSSSCKPWSSSPYCNVGQGCHHHPITGTSLTCSCGRHLWLSWTLVSSVGFISWTLVAEELHQRWFRRAFRTVLPREGGPKGHPPLKITSPTYFRSGRTALSSWWPRSS